MKEKIFRLSEFISGSNCQELIGATACFGHFNAIHPGHLRHFQTAREYGTPLVVAVEGDSHLREVEQASYFSQEERAQAVGALSLIDYVMILDDGSLEDFVSLIDLTTLVLGKEFEGIRSTKIATAIDVAHQKGVQIFYDAGETHYASSDLLSGNPNELEKERWQVFLEVQQSQGVDLNEVFSIIDQASPPRLLVVGDTIVDRYVACDPIGMSNEAPVIVVKEIETRDYIGGAGIVSAHVAALGSECTYLSVTGCDEYSSFVAESLDRLDIEPVLLEDQSRPTTFKIRYLVENQKLFRVSRLKEHSLPRQIEDRLIREISERACQLDGILISDFVYGVVTPRIISALSDVSSEYDIPLFGDLQCSSQIGSILKFQKFFLTTPTEREARIALGNHDDGVEYVANLLMEKTKSANMILKLGGDGFIAYMDQQGEADVVQRQHFPALTGNPIDVAGAGDALISAMAVGLTSGLSFIQAASLANCVSAIAVQTIGNRPISLDQVRRFYSQHTDR